LAICGNIKGLKCEKESYLEYLERAPHESTLLDTEINEMDWLFKNNGRFVK